MWFLAVRPFVFTLTTGAEPGAGRDITEWATLWEHHRRPKKADRQLELSTILALPGTFKGLIDPTTTHL